MNELQKALTRDDVCPECLGELDTGRECTKCGYDASPHMGHFTNIHGPKRCPKPCSVCSSGRHHWMTCTFPGCLDETCDDWEESLNHPAVQDWLTIKRADGSVFVKADYNPTDGHITYLVCKHCEAWHELTEEMMADPDFDVL